jgi:hypothetical protein
LQIYFNVASFSFIFVKYKIYSSIHLTLKGFIFVFIMKILLIFYLVIALLGRAGLTPWNLDLRESGGLVSVLTGASSLTGASVEGTGCLERGLR